MGVQVLVVDDERELREVLIEALVAHGFTADGAGDVEEALQWIATNGAPKVILLDMMLGALSGLDFLYMRGHLQHLMDVPVFVCTASKQFEKNPPAGALRVFLKPVNLRAVTAAVAEVVK